LLEATGCHILLVAQDFPALIPLVTSLASKKELQVIPFNATSHWIGQDKVVEYPFHATLEKDASRPFVILHTSGSTGMVSVIDILSVANRL
jgi:hypothetical protein